MTTTEATELVFVPGPASLEFYDPAAVVEAAKNQTTASNWTVTPKRGASEGGGVSVPGLDAWASVYAGFSFTMARLESSKTYRKLVTLSSIPAGVSGFFSWLGVGAHAWIHHAAIQQALREMTQSPAVAGTVQVELEVSGAQPTAQLSASAYIEVLEITDDEGNKTLVCTNQAPADIGCQDQHGKELPTRSNQSTITIG